MIVVIVIVIIVVIVIVKVATCDNNSGRRLNNDFTGGRPNNHLGWSLVFYSSLKASVIFQLR